MKIENFPFRFTHRQWRVEMETRTENMLTSRRMKLDFIHICLRKKNEWDKMEVEAKRLFSRRNVQKFHDKRFGQILSGSVDFGCKAGAVYFFVV